MTKKILMNSLKPSLVLAITCLMFHGVVSAQKTKSDRREEKKQRINALAKQEEEGVIAFRKQTVFGFKLLNDGYGMFLEIGRAQSVKKSLLFQFELSERKHPKEEKQSNIVLETAPFVYGKINYFYPMRLGVQQQFLLGNKTNKNGVSVTANFGGGLSLGFLRPYYLEISDPNTLGRRNIKYESADSSFFRDNNALMNYYVTGSRFGVGWNEIKVTPGLYLKSALRFDYGRYNEMVNGLEVGLNVDYYTKNIPQLIFVDPKKLFFNAYITLVFGKRK
jgi:hypothetical protein